ncbi:MAG: hypothetical protein F3741_04765 [Nitrospinae bacterium]|nr:hypothetical protein [Nitrospinota bacterium]
MDQSLGSKLDLILDGGTCPGGKPSTLVDPVEMPVQLIRPGAIPFSEIEIALYGNSKSTHPEARG